MKFKRDLSERILLHLYKLREDFKFHDLLDKFDRIDKAVLYKATDSLKKRGLIDTEHQVNFRSTPNRDKRQDRQSGENMNAKIKSDGIEYVKAKLLLTSNMAKPIAIIEGLVIIGATVYGFYKQSTPNQSDQTESKTLQKLEQTNLKVDSLLRIIDQYKSDSTTSEKK